MRIVVKGGVWKNTEDEILKAAVMKYGKNNWARVASLMNRKSAKQCKARWYEWLDPSIRKVEWSREEEEKLLHLAKLMPNQWRSIAPIVGRTAGQCLEHYEELLDRAQQEQTGGDAAERKPEDDPRRLRPGEIDPAPENKPARPDPVDMDEDEKEMLQEARARLANTKGKKAKRKAREAQLEEARHLAVLQKHRELKAAGIDSKLLLGSRKKRKQGIDYINEIPFQKTVPAGFYDVNDEVQVGKRAKLDPKKAGRDMIELEGRAEAEAEEKAKRRENARVKRLFKDNAPQAILRIAQENDPAALRRRVELSLPAPQVGDAELEAIVKYGRIGGGGGAGSTISSALGGDLSMPPPSAHSSALMGHDYSSRAGLALPAPTRTPIQTDTIMQEALNLHAQRAASAGGGPLTGAELPELYEGTGFDGAQPRAARLATPNGVLAPTPASMRGAGGSVFATPASVFGAASSFGGSVRGTPFAPRDALGLNVAGGSHHGFSGMPDAAMMDDSRSVTSSAYSVMQKEQRAALALALKALPEPEYTYEVSVPSLPADDNVEGSNSLSGGRRADAAEVAARARALRAAQEAQAYARRSAPVARGLPRPTQPLRTTDAERLQQSSWIGHSGAASTEGKESDADLKVASELVNREMLLLLARDRVLHPPDSTDAAGGVGSLVGSKRSRGGAAVSVTSGPRVSAEAPVLEDLSDELISAARVAVKEETQRMLQADPVLNALSSATERTAHVASEFSRAWEQARSNRMFIPNRDGGVMGVPATAQEMAAARALQLAALKEHVEREHKRAAKLEAKLEVLTAGYVDRSERTEAALHAAFNTLQQKTIELQCFKASREAEVKIAMRRRAEAEALAEQARQVEAELQKEFAMSL